MLQEYFEKSGLDEKTQEVYFQHIKKVARDMGVSVEYLTVNRILQFLERHQYALPIASQDVYRSALSHYLKYMGMDLTVNRHNLNVKPIENALTPEDFLAVVPAMKEHNPQLAGYFSMLYFGACRSSELQKYVARREFGFMIGSRYLHYELNPELTECLEGLSSWEPIPEDSESVMRHLIYRLRQVHELDVSTTQLRWHYLHHLSKTHCPEAIRQKLGYPSSMYYIGELYD